MAIILSPNLTFFLVSFWALIPQRVSILSHQSSKSLRLASKFLSYTEWHKDGSRYQISAIKALEYFGVIFNDKEKIYNYFPQPLCQYQLAPKRQNKFLIGIGVSAGKAFKSLSSEQIILLCSRLITIKNLTVVLIGTAKDKKTAKKIIRSLPKGRIIDSSGAILLSELGTFMRSLDCFIGVDSGATYIADAVGVPVIDIMGPASSKEQRPLGPKAIILNSIEPCAPCSSTFAAPNSCYLGTRACIKNMDLELIFQSVKKIIFK